MISDESLNCDFAEFKILIDQNRVFFIFFMHHFDCMRLTNLLLVTDYLNERYLLFSVLHLTVLEVTPSRTACITSLTITK